MEDLELNGYFLLKNKLSNNEINYLNYSILDNLVNYSNIQSHIDNNLISIVNESFNWNIIYCKYRVSNNNNSTDASIFHRDIINYTNSYKCPCYTLLIYLDNTIMEFIQYSHLQPNMNVSTAFINYFKNKIIINIEIGDILIINSALIHRGIFSKNKNNRKLIQIFDVFKNRIDYDKYSNLFIHIPSSLNENNYYIRKLCMIISKKYLLISFISFILYFNAACGYNYNTYHTKSNKYISSEGSQNRLIVISNSLQENNKYIICQNINSLNINKIKYYQLFISFYFENFIKILIIIFLLYFIHKKYHKK